jgi:hypothetical protein
MESIEQHASGNYEARREKMMASALGSGGHHHYLLSGIRAHTRKAATRDHLISVPALN